MLSSANFYFDPAAQPIQPLHINTWFIKHFFFISILLILKSISAFAQLKADSTADQENGYSPLTVKFTNTTIGASANAMYKWDLGNGATSNDTAKAAGTYFD